MRPGITAGRAALAAALATALALSTASANSFAPAWHAERQDFDCQLASTIAHLGELQFVRRPESPLRLVLRADIPLARTDAVQLQARPPAWRADLRGQSLSDHANRGEQPDSLHFDPETSQRAFDALAAGHALYLGLRAGSPLRRFDIAVPVIGFNGQRPAFERCAQAAGGDLRQSRERERAAAEFAAMRRAEVLRLGVAGEAPAAAALSTTSEGPEPAPAVNSLSQLLHELPAAHRVLFAAGDTELSAEAAAVLDQWVRRIEIAGAPPTLTLHGHSHAPAERDHLLDSGLRAEAVARYLIERLPDIRLRILSHADRLAPGALPAERVDLVPSDYPNWG